MKKVEADEMTATEARSLAWLKEDAEVGWKRAEEILESYGELLEKGELTTTEKEMKQSIEQELKQVIERELGMRKKGTKPRMRKKGTKPKKKSIWEKLKFWK